MLSKRIISNYSVTSVRTAELRLYCQTLLRQNFFFKFQITDSHFVWNKRTYNNTRIDFKLWVFMGIFFLTLYISLIMVLIKSQIPWIICSFSYCSSKLTGFSIHVIFIHNLLVNYISTVYLHSARVQFKQLML